MNDFNELKKMIIDMNDIERLIEGITFGTVKQLKFPYDGPARKIQSRMISPEDYLNKIKELETKILDYENKIAKGLKKSSDILNILKEAGDAVGQELAERNISISEFIDLKCPSARKEDRTPQEVYQSIKDYQKDLFEHLDTEEIIKAESVSEIIFNKDEKWSEYEMKINIRYKLKDKE